MDLQQAQSFICLTSFASSSTASVMNFISELQWREDFFFHSEKTNCEGIRSGVK